MMLKLVTGLLGACLLAAAGCGRPGESDLQAGLKSARQGRHVRAKDYFEKAIAANPPAPVLARAWNNLGIANWRLGETNEAARAFEQCRRIDPSLADATYNLGVLCARTGDVLRAETLLTEAALTDAEDTRAQEYLASLYLAGGRPAEARNVLMEAMARAPRSPSVLTAMARLDLEQVGVSAATARLKQALSVEPDYPPALYNLAVIAHTHRKDPADTRRLAGRFLSVAPDSPAAPAVRAILMELGPEPAPAATPTNPPPAAAESDFDALLEQARQLARGGSDQAALRLFLQAAEQARRDGRADRREKALQTAADVAFGLAESHRALGLFLLETGRPDAAATRFKQALMLQPDDSSIRFDLARAAIELKDYELAAISLRTILETKTGDLEARLALADLLDRRMKLVPEALVEYRVLLRTAPQDPRVAALAGRVKELESRPAPTPVIAPVPRPAPTATNPPPPAAAATAVTNARPAATAAATNAVPPAPAAPANAVAATPAATNAAPAAVATPAATPRTTVPETNRTATSTSVVRAAPRDPAAAIQSFNRASEHQLRGDLTSAIFFYKRAIENDPQFASAYFKLALLHREQGDAEAAADAFRRGLAASPDDAGMRFNFALTLYEQRAFDASARELRTLLRREPANDRAHYLLGLVLAESGADAGQARDHFKRFLELNPNDPNADDVREWIRNHP